MRRKTAVKNSPEKVSRRTSRRGRKSTTVSPERNDASEGNRTPNEEADAEPEISEQPKSDDSGSEQEEVHKRNRGGRRTPKRKSSETPEKSTSRPRRSSRRRSVSVEQSDKEESEDNAVVMETIPEEKAEAECVAEVVKAETVAVQEQDQHQDKDTKIDQEATTNIPEPEQEVEPEIKEQKVNGNDAKIEPEPTIQQLQVVEVIKPDLCEQSRESGEVDSESVQDDESQQALSKQEEPTKEASPNKEASGVDSSSEKDQRPPESSSKPARKSRFSSRSKSPVQKENKPDEDEELEAGEIKEDEPIPKRSPEKKAVEEKPIRRPLQRKRRWLSSKPDTKSTVITISTDSLKNIISEPVRPVPLSDVKLESSPEPEEIVDSTEEQSANDRRRSKDKPSKSSEKENAELDTEQEYKPKPIEKTVATVRKISIVSDDGSNAVAKPPSPARHHSSNILFITNLVRPFTVLQLKSLLARTGKIVENGFWIDKIKSKCFIKYETEDEAVETRHALHGVRWPTSNPKCLNVDFGTESAMEKAIISTLDEAGSTRITIDNSKDTKEFGWSRDTIKQEQDNHVTRPVREWDLGKKDTFDNDRSRGEADRSGRGGRNDEGGRGDRGTAGGRRRSTERDYGRDRDRRRNSTSLSPARKFKKKENDPPIRLLDDLFRKTKATPCIYWLPLTAEQIAAKEEQRRKTVVENQRRQEEARKQEEERRKRRQRPRSNSRDRRRRSRSRDDGRRRHR